MAKYGKKAADKVGKAVHEMKEGKLKSGKSGKKVTSQKTSSRHRAERGPQGWRQSSQEEIMA